ncbi:MAG: hypothetical protein IJE27_05250 [Anaerotignum sp.]|nr:hypothetical protein [Anaerotignum sp.]
MQLVDSEEYAKKFSELFPSKVVQESVVEKCRKIIHHRDGTRTEEIYFLDNQTGRVLGYAKGKAENGIERTAKIESLLTRAKAKSIIVVHNHPGSTTFSKADISRMLEFESIDATIAAGHNGDVYYAADAYNAENAIRDYRVAYSKYVERYKMGDSEARDKAWTSSAMTSGFDYKRR